MTRLQYLALLKKLFIFFMYFLGTGVLQAQIVKVELVSGEVTVYKKGTTVTSKVIKNEKLAQTDRIYLGENALLVIADQNQKLLALKKKGYYTGKDLLLKLSNAPETECYRYLTYIIKEINNYEAALKFSSSKVNNLQNYGNEFLATLPDTLRMFAYDQLKIKWSLSKNTELVNVLVVNDKKNVILDLDVAGQQISFNNISSYFLINKSLNLSLYERKKDGNKVLGAKTVLLPANLDKAKTKQEFELEFKDFDDLRLNKICQAVKWEINHYALTALDIYKILLLDYPNDSIVKSSFAAFTLRTGLE